ncbi:MAG: carboxypeptidase regulatory-like domain-containing protein [bacterium]|nr:carboxypeptidase regulatory-like domain-containing protein [bacterium]
MKHVFPFFISFLLGIQAVAAPVRFSVSEATGTQPLPESIPATLIAKLSSRASTAKTPTERTIELLAPGQKLVDIEAGPWSFDLKIEGFWVKSQLMQIEEGKNQVNFTMWSVGTLQARLTATGNEELPQQLVAYFDPAPDTAPSAAAPEGAVACPTSEPLWTCEVPAGHLDLRLAADGYISLYRWGVAVTPGKSYDLGTLPLRRGTAVVGWVETETGATAEGIRVILRPRFMDQHRDSAARTRLERLRLTAETNDRGFFHIDGTPPGEYVIEASKEPFSPARATVRVLEDQETVISNPPLILREPQVVEVYVEPPVPPMGEHWLIEMTQLDRGSRPMALFDRTAVSAGGLWSRKDVPPGSYTLRLGPSPTERWYLREIEVDSNMPPLFIDLPVVEVRGSVLWGMEPLTAEIWFGGQNGAISVVFDSDDEGRFAGFLPHPGMWEVEINGVDWPVNRRFRQIEVKKRPGKTHAGVEIRIPDTRIEGIVVDQEGTPAERAIVTVQSLDEIEPTIRKRIDEEGRFEVYGLPPGLATAVAEGPSSGSMLYSETVAVDLEGGGEPRKVRLVLRPEMAIHGRVVAGNRGIPGVRIMAQPCHEHGLPVFPETTDAEGNFEIHLPSATLEVFLHVSAPGFGYQFMRLPVDPDRALMIPVSEASGTLIVDLPASPDRNLRISPDIVLSHRGAMEGLPFFLSWARFHGQRPVEGAPVVIPWMEPGEYSVCLISSERSSLARDSGPRGGCVGGHLPASGELRLSLAGSAAD